MSRHDRKPPERRPSDTAIGRCVTSGKLMQPSRQKAKAQIRKHRAAKPTWRGREYRCAACGCWHVATLKE